MQSETANASVSREVRYEDGIAFFCGELSESDQRTLRDAALSGVQLDLARSIPSTLSLFATSARNVIGNIRTC